MKFRVNKDQFALLLLSAGLMLLALLLPWVMQRPNRLAQGVPMPLPPLEALVGALVALCLPISGRFAPRFLAVCSNLGLVFAVLVFGQQTSIAVQRLPEFARASASSGLWLWVLGASIGFYTAQLSAQGVWRSLMWTWLPVVLGLFVFGQLQHWSVMLEFRVQQARFFQELLQNVVLVGLALLTAGLLGMPLAVWAARRPRVAGLILGVAGGIQTVPSLALLGLLIAPLAALANAVPWLRSLGVAGIGTTPALIAMTLYALLPILRNGVVALRGVGLAVMDAASGMGMTDNQRFWRVQLPLALPVWLSGFRQAVVVLVGVSSVAQLIGAGGLGFFIFGGLQNGATDLILLGAIPAALLAVLADTMLRAAEMWLGKRLGSA
jgi:osmoprotectant transport system permease protein